LWFMGRGMTSWYVRRTAGREARGLRRAEQWFQHYGVWSLLLSWVPIVGDPLCLVAGSLRIRLSLFCILVATGKCMRYLSVWYLTQYVASS
ncbi:MAG: YqaA family protein, partial [Trichlorobacter sp.]